VHTIWTATFGPATPATLPRLRRLVGVAVLALAAACATTTSQAPPAGRGAEPADAVDVRAMQADERTAVDTIDTYWRRHFSQFFDRPYRGPRVAGGYRGTDGPRCGGQPPVPFNAFYCPDGDFLAWDENLMAAGYRQIGDAWVYLIIAHEWGHAVQARLDRSRVSVAAELQADCLAGAVLQGSVRDGLIALEPGDSQELVQTLAAVADDYPWTDERDHGDASQRIGSFNLGARDGVPACTT
jgi:uncharacterized protein